MEADEERHGEGAALVANSSFAACLKLWCCNQSEREFDLQPTIVNEPTVSDASSIQRPQKPLTRNSPASFL